MDGDVHTHKDEGAVGMWFYLRVCQRMLLENIEPISASDTPTTSARVGDAPPSAAPEQVQPEQPLQHLQTTSRREPNLVQDEFLRALECADFYNSDRAILEQLFTLLDKTGEEMVNVHEILVGCCVLLKGGVAAKLQDSLRFTLFIVFCASLAIE
uniref:EF-hand domain-containing protein n=1 Tax=Globisporangium ultimum (strain ATCC 200006 / CBS 805.95 / DAOM BR144) TaxID=431595 RepID=K3WT73_GLOUD